MAAVPAVPAPPYHRDLVDAARSGSAAAFGLLYEAHALEVLAFFRRRCNDPAEAEDLLSVVFLEAWRCHDRVVLVDGTVRPWLYGIAANVLRNATRSKRRQSSALARFHAQNADLSEADHADGVIAAVAAQSGRTTIADAFTKLSHRERAVAELVLLEGLDISAVAMALGLDEKTAASRLRQARRRLQRLLRTSELLPLHRDNGHQHDERSTTAPVSGGSFA